MIEVHPDPERALSGGFQCLDFPQFAETMARCRRTADAVGKTLHAMPQDEQMAPV
jgi:3-deoxy-7-phosphoheptulonate synthase